MGPPSPSVAVIKKRIAGQPVNFVLGPGKQVPVAADVHFLGILLQTGNAVAHRVNRKRENLQVVDAGTSAPAYIFQIKRRNAVPKGYGKKSSEHHGIDNAVQRKALVVFQL